MWPGAAGALEAIGVGLDERTNAVDDRGFGREGVAIAGQHFEERPAGHGKWIVVSC